jgi:hypothetical protein
MDENLIKALVGIGGALAGALLVAATNAYAANRKIKEIEISYIHKLRDGYLENARKMSEQVYIPINILLTCLMTDYDKLRVKINFDENTVPIGSYNTFLAASRQYLKGIDNLFTRGADAYLTLDLDKRLQDFNSFIRESTAVDGVVKKVVFEASSGKLFASIPSAKFEHRTKSRTLSNFGIANFSFSVLGLGLRFGYVEEILAAPFQSREFELRIQKDTSEIKSLIKEVVLGTHAA